MSRIVRTGSQLSTSTSSSIDSSSHNHILSSFHSIQNLSSWLNTTWLPHNHRHERIATATISTGMAVLTREMMEMHIQQAPDMRGMLDCLPVADKSGNGFVGWRQKLGTWPTV
ncbi:hypothetical protein LHYA1_G001790 [Lachnellula hyalina]|uniref:Uncharacterized protein n=1 Tax=Lachnellula hyalina TaxID=1316788 RepID=A0A8H8RAP0_9HELO|nr:uncharacterized protein LHYA1_G001790 [Lachnellula hyalina]TVY29900.1 hypothetical protein LHYA1_G001790 [Lachnellula hyalina]